MRAALPTTLGIVIGVAAVIAMMEIGSGSSSASRQPSPVWANNSLSLDRVRLQRRRQLSGRAAS